MTTKNTIQCRRCNQGTILSMRVKKTKNALFICDECEAIWFCKKNIEYATFNYFNLYMERQGLPALWSELEYD